MKGFALGCLVLVACGDDGSSGPKTIAIDRSSSATVDVLAFRDGDGAWQPLSIDATEIVVAGGHYALASGCTISLDGTPVLVQNVLNWRTVDDEPPTLGCITFDFSTTSNETRHLVQVQMAEPGELHLGGAQTSGTMANWTAMLEVASGTHALVALDATRIFVQRGIAVSGPMTLPSVSLASAPAFVTPTFTLDGLGDETVGWYSDVEIDDSRVWDATGTGLAVRTAPESVFAGGVPEDNVRNIYLSTGSRNVYFTDYRDALGTSFELMPKLSGIGREGRRITFDALPAYEYLTVVGGDGMFSDFTLATKRFVEATGSKSLELDFSMVPGFGADRVLGGEFLLSFYANIDDSDTLFRDTYVSL